MTTVSKNVYYDVLDDILKKYNNTQHSTIKMKPIDVKDNTYINTDKKELIIKVLNLKQAMVLGFRIIKICLLRDMYLIGVKKFLL